MIVRVKTVDFRCGVGVDEGNAVGCGVDEGVGERFAFVLRFVEILQLLWMQLRDGESVVLKEEIAAVGAGGKTDLRIPLPEVLYELPMPCR